MTVPMTEPGSPPPLLHRLIAAGHLRYWLISSWALVLAAVTSWQLALAWFVVATLSGVARTIVETRIRLTNAGQHARLKLLTATASCIAWAAAPLLAATTGGALGFTVATALLICGYTLVFTQMRAEPREALIVSLPYTAVVAGLVAGLWGTSAFWVAATLIPVVSLALVIKVVITQIKDRELAAINAAQARLIDELAEARDRANAASTAKSNFLGVVSHELRTPMNGVLGAAQILQMSGLSDKQSEMVNIIRSSGDSLMGLLNDILDMTKIEAGKMELRPQAVATKALIEKMVGRGPRPAICDHDQGRPARKPGRRSAASVPDHPQPVGQCRQIHRTGHGQPDRRRHGFTQRPDPTADRGQRQRYRHCRGRP